MSAATTTVAQEPHPDQIFKYSLKLDTTAKGLIVPTVHVYANDMETARKEAVEQYDLTLRDLQRKGLPTVLDGAGER